jgi:outer membrane protein assembly factor BamB
MGANVLVTTRSGRVFKLDVASGNVAAAVQLPQACRVSPAIATGGNFVYQLADHSHLFALSATDLKCAGVVYVGHEPAASVVPPQVVGQHLVVADNAGAGDATLHVVALKDDGMPQGIVQRVDVPGQVLTPPIVLGKHLVVITDRGANVPLRITTDRSTPLERLNEAGASADQPVARFGLPLGEKLVVAGDGLRLDALDASSGNFQPTWAAFAGEALLGPPQQTGDVLFCVRRDPSGAGNIAAAVQASTGKSLWQTRFAVPLAAGPLPNASGQATMIATAHGEIAKLDEASWQGPSIHSFAATVANLSPLPRIAGGWRLASGDVVLFPASGASQLLVVPADGAALRSLPLPGPLAAAPLLMGERILAVCSSGDVVLLNPATGEALADPLQIPISPGQGLTSCSLAALGELAILADGSGSLRQLGVEQGPPPRLVEQVAAKLTAPRISPIAALGQHAFAVDRTGELRSFQLPGLIAAESFKLGAETIVFGPERVGELMLLATDRDELWCIGAGPKQLWKIPLTRGPLAGSPLAAGDSLILATKSGALTRISASTGKEVANLDLGQSLAGTPAAAGQFVLVPAADGTLLKVKLPAEGAASP